jgi:hypothetical protein
VIVADAARFTEWRKSSLSSGSDNCVEVAFSVDGHAGVRHSRDHSDGPVLVFTAAEWAAFVGGVRLGEFEQETPR